VHTGIVGGNGEVLLSRVAPGEYTLIVVSEHSRNSPDLQEPTIAVLDCYFDEEKHGLYRTQCKDIEVFSDEETEHSVAFGMTYF